MTDHLIEIVFKNIPTKKIGRLFTHLIGKGNIITNYSITIEHSEIKWNVETIQSIFDKNKDFGLFINLNALQTGKIELPNCGLSIYKYEDTIDLEINFQLSDLGTISLQSLAKSLMEFAKSIADQYQIDEYLCGLEPAHDPKTRLFTNGKLGPCGFVDGRPN